MFIDFSLSDDEYVADGIWGNLFAEVNPKLGPLALDECYTFEPALSIGGAAEARNVIKAKLLPQLTILAQLNGPIRMMKSPTRSRSPISWSSTFDWNSKANHNNFDPWTEESDLSRRRPRLPTTL